MQAIILAAGMGKRLKELTKDNTKCMVAVNGETLIKRALRQLDGLGLKQIVLVVGYKGEKLTSYVNTLQCRTPIVYVDNPIYDKTNNIYSLYLAKDYLLEDDTLLLESDLILEDGILERMVDNTAPNLVLATKYESWMDGTVVTIDENGDIIRFLDKKQFQFCHTNTYYKTVNIYKFSKTFSQSHYVPFLEVYSKALGNNEYYEQVLKVIALLDNPGLKAMVLKKEKWYEIDDVQDLDIAETLFEPDGAKRFDRFNSRYGGYWRYPGMLDYCYLVNPYYPSPKMVEEMQASFDVLLRQYPSGQQVNNLLAANYYGLRREQVMVGNGAAELIKALVENTQGTIGMVSPSFDEYRNRAKPEQLSIFTPDTKDFSYSADDLISFFGDKHLSMLLLINPDNPSGNFIPTSEVLRVAAWCKEREILFVLDESFSDFADTREPATLLDQAILKQYDNLVVIKSISKSFGVPGIRLGVLASTNTDVLTMIGKEVSIWNINSFGEFFMQIWGKYRSSYAQALVSLKETRKNLSKSLESVGWLRVIPSEANYLMCELKEGMSSHDLAVHLLEKHNILIKDLSTKRGIAPRQCIRLAVRDEEDNATLIKALEEYDVR